MVEGARVRLYFRDGETVQACSTGLDQDGMKSRLEEMTPNGAVFAFQDESWSRVEGGTLLTRNLEDLSSYAVRTPDRRSSPSMRGCFRPWASTVIWLTAIGRAVLGSMWTAG